MTTSVPNDEPGGYVMYETTQPPKRGGTIALIAMAAGLIGAIACLLLAGGVWAGRSWANDKVDEVTASVTAVIDNGGSVVDTVTERLNTISANLDQITAQAAAVANNPTPTEADEGTLRASLQDLGTRYDEIHASYEDLSVKIQGAIDGLASLQKVFGSLDPLVQTLNDAFTTVDQRIATLDATITDVRTSVQNAQALPAMAKSIVAGRLTDAVSKLSDSVGQLGGRIDKLRAQVNEINDKAHNYLTLGAIAGTVLFLWLFLVHAGLFHYARRARRA
jgi:phage shock protein A